MKPLARIASCALLGAAALSAVVVWRSGWLRGDETAGSAGTSTSAPADSAALVARGAYLATVGNCASCHTARGGAAMAGGRALATPFGTVWAGNLTPDPETGLGRWNADDFWRALHHGRSRDGRFLLPAFPFPQYTLVTRADADALWAWLRSLPAVRQPNRPHELRFPYGTQPAQAVWRGLYFQPGTFQPDAGRSAAWNRGAYLVDGLGHCAACHAPRNAFGATENAQALDGGLIPMQGWYAPSLASPQEAAMSPWPRAEVVALLQNGRNARASVLGPMAEVVLNSTQHLTAADLQAMAEYLQALPQHAAPRTKAEPAPPGFVARGQEVYDEHCAGCHGAQGEGAAGAYPALAGNRALALNTATNLVRVVLSGGFPPATAGNPRPYGMPPFGQTLSDADIAAVVSFLRERFGGGAAAVSPLDVQRLR